MDGQPASAAINVQATGTVQKCLICNCDTIDTKADLTQDLDLQEDEPSPFPVYIKTEDGEGKFNTDPRAARTANLDTFCRLLNLSTTCTNSLLTDLPTAAGSGTPIFCAECRGIIQNVAILFEQVRQLQLQVDSSRNLVETQIQQCFSDHVSSFEGTQRSHNCKSIRRGRGRPPKNLTKQQNHSRCSPVEQFRELIVADLHSSSQAHPEQERTQPDPAGIQSSPENQQCYLSIAAPTRTRYKEESERPEARLPIISRAKRKYTKRKPRSDSPQKKKIKAKGPVSCSECSAVFPAERYHQYHRKKVHDMSHYLTFCSTCGKRFFSQQTLETHLRLQGGTCKKDPLPDLVIVQMEVGTPNYKCKICERGMVTRHQMENHLASHTNPKRYTCEICGERFNLMASLGQHKLAKHPDPNVPHPFACSEPGCRRVFGLEKLLRFHEKAHRNDFHLCEHCPYKTVYAGTLSSHIRTVHEGQRKHKCPHCPSTYKTRPHLQKHIYNTHTAPEDRPFKCSECTKTFPDKYSLDRHVITQHTKLKPLRCKICDKRFAVGDYLRVHMRTHMGKQQSKKKPLPMVKIEEAPASAAAGAEILPLL